MNYKQYKIAYIVADLKRIGPTNQTLNIIRYSGAIENCVVFTLFDESEDTLVSEYRDCGIEVKCLHLSRKNALFIGVKRLRKELISSGANIVHSWGTFADIITYYASKKLNVKHMITLRNFPVEEMTTRMNYCVGLCVAHIDLHILKKCKNVVACSNSIKNKMEETYGWTHLKSIQNGVDFNKFYRLDKELVRKELGINNKKLVFIATGSMIPRKRIEETVGAFIAAKKTDAELWLLGDGFLLDKLRKEYSSYENVKFLGKKNNVPYYLSAADVFVSSSESEGMPNAVLEAIACNLPVYLSDIPQHQEVLETIPECGKSYKLGCFEELSILYKNTTHSFIEKYTENTVKLYDSPFTMENMGKKYESYYETLIS